MIAAQKLVKPTKNNKEDNKNEKKFDKLDISLLTRNITNLFEQIKTVTNDVQIKKILIEN
jgi:hypothetical protein